MMRKIKTKGSTISYSPSDVATVEEAIGSQWMKSPELEVRTGFSGPKIRAIASGSFILVSNTKQGYRHIDHATFAEFEHSIADLRSRIGKIAKRALAMENHLSERQATQHFTQGTLL